MAGEVLLDIAGLSVRFGGVQALADVDLQVRQGAIHGLIGPNGAGKTTLLNCISRLVEPQAGSMRFAGTDLLRCRPWQIAGAGIARTFQNFGLVGELSVLDNVMAGMHAVHPASLLDELVRPGRRRRAEDSVRTRALEALGLMDLLPLADRPVGALPYGLRKNVELARAIATQPRLVLLDEPTAGLSHHDMQALHATLSAWRRRGEFTVLVITHHIEFLLAIADEVTVLDLGRTIARGVPSLVRSDPAVVRAYVGTED
ncbi:ABC transporter ATP-binding protein [Pseudorhodoferax sp.]|uniref:ABC transporter ATP-binding protein n=1 Tax=Pseudorhodoferax sp. TaxID=1993553 RepID=UPI002DD62599|nr:ABC transporter ATP-binding protein [Pseudorhodoferax sp.]